MIIKEMFKKDIERQIRGVIKVAQDDAIYQELDEYVVTNEIASYLDKFYDNYQKSINGSTYKMGVWISGFFGSGKSHFLKMLSYLLSNKEVNGKKSNEFFEEKISDNFLKSSIQKAGKINTEIILFNIDSKSTADNKTKENAILKVFARVFYEHLGYYGEKLGIAQLEKYLDDNGKLDIYKKEFKKLSGDDWEKRRRTFLFDGDFVVGALKEAANMTEETARNWYENGSKNIELSIESFAKEVKEYCDKKGPDFHLVFLVDEIGQYIGDDHKLMLNLQTITEDLGTFCHGKVWVIVTSQESIDKVVKVKGDDFSKIQGRFDTRISLSSISVDEVIKKRILEKKLFAIDSLQLLYQEKSAILKNLISFKESTADFKGYTSDIEFAAVYPFIPYQFRLLQNVFEQIRKHENAGKHLAEGERSMLSAFQESTLQYKDQQDGLLIPFYAFYNTIREFLNPSISRVIENAKKNDELKDDTFNIDLLKVLFMVKYIKELPANIDNLATLMVTSIDEDKLKLKEKIQESLLKLIKQTLIQKNGDVYIFLTDDEQDVNREIKSIIIDEESVKKQLGNDIYQNLYDEKKVKYDNYNFTYNKVMDEKDYSPQTNYIGINIITPLSDYYFKSEEELSLMTSGSGNMIMRLPNSNNYIEEMEEILKIYEYLNKKNINQLPENIKPIVEGKRTEAQARRRRVTTALEELIKNAEFYIYGSKTEIKGSTVKEKINNAFRILIDIVYDKLSYIKRSYENDYELREIFTDNLFDDHSNDMALDKIMEFISMNDDMNKQIQFKSIINQFTNKPYGWNELDIAGLVATLFKNQKIRLRINGENLTVENVNKVIEVLRKSSEFERLIILKRKESDPELIKKVKLIIRDLFSVVDFADDEDNLVKDIKSLISKQVDHINSLKNRYEGRKYPGLSVLEKGINLFKDFTHGMDNQSFFNKLTSLENDFTEWKENFADVESFFKNQKEIFDKGVIAVKKYNDNIMYLTNQEIKESAEQLKEIIENVWPFTLIRKIPELASKVNEGIQLVINDRKDRTKDKINEDLQYLNNQASQYGVSDTIKKLIENDYKGLLNNLELFDDIYKVDALVTRSNELKSKFEASIRLELRKKQQDDNDDGQDGGVAESKQPKTVRMKTLLGTRRRFSSEAEVDEFIKSLSETLKSYLKDSDIEIVD